MIAIGTRVEIPAWSDQWMRGARYGEVVSISSTGVVKVKLDKYKRAVRFQPENLKII